MVTIFVVLDLNGINIRVRILRHGAPQSVTIAMRKAILRENAPPNPEGIMATTIFVEAEALVLCDVITAEKKDISPEIVPKKAMTN